MGSNQALVAVAEASGVDRTVLGGKAAVLAELLAAGFPVPPGIVVTAAALDDPDLDTQLASLAGRLGGDRSRCAPRVRPRTWQMPRTPACTRPTSTCRPPGWVTRCGDASPPRSASGSPPTRSPATATKPS